MLKRSRKHKRNKNKKNEGNKIVYVERVAYKKPKEALEEVLKGLERNWWY